MVYVRRDVLQLRDALLQEGYSAVSSLQQEEGFLRSALLVPGVSETIFEGEACIGVI